MNYNASEIMFSVIICCYNSEKFIEKTIESVINQTFNNFEIIIINDGSTDNTRKYVLNYERKYNFIKYFEQKNLGYSASRNTAINYSSGKWIVILDHDDIMYPDRLKIHNENILKYPSKKIFFGNCKIVENDKTTSKFNEFKKNIILPQ